jgi:hypothetical protein
MGRAAWLSAGVIIIATKVRWELHDRRWFWAVILLIAVLHLPLVFLVPWTSQWIPAALLFPFCAVDGIAILGIIQVVEKWMAPAI